MRFSLTRDQEKALDDIDQDMAASAPMLRLLQGDVGSGKTIVGFLAMLNAVGGGAQAAMMAPTEILASQHGENLRPLCEACGVELISLTSRAKGAERARLLEAIAAPRGDVGQVIVGTHSLFQKDVVFADLGIAIIDEQHRFGVHQRLALSSKSALRANILVMTATPIPRTLTLTACGDMDVSYIREKPAGRKPITTSAIALSRIDDVVAAINRAIGQGQKAYWVCPLIEYGESDEDQPETKFMTATERYHHLCDALDHPIGIVHGKINAAERDDVLARFQSGQISLLVATSVIEVGVDIPDATIMVIEHAERFGLAQLHQLRGRVGRADKPSSCLLIYREPLNPIARQRLESLRKSNDGFHIAEADLQLRGSGELLGTRQSGAPEFKLARLDHHQDLLLEASQRAKEIVAANPLLEGDEGRRLRILLHLFKREDIVNYPRSG